LKPTVRGYYLIIVDPEPNYRYEKQWENGKFKDKILPTVIDEIPQDISHVTGKRTFEKVRLRLKTSSNGKEVEREALVHKGDEDLWEKIKRDFRCGSRRLTWKIISEEANLTFGSSRFMLETL
jgi:hypothetical protein